MSDEFTLRRLQKEHPAKGRRKFWQEPLNLKPVSVLRLSAEIQADLDQLTMGGTDRAAVAQIGRHLMHLGDKLQNIAEGHADDEF